MIPQTVQFTLPVWAQIVIVAASIAANLATTLFVLLVLWPSIRNQERRAARFEQWMETPEWRRIRAAILAKVEGGDGMGSQPVDKDEWTRGICQEGDL